VNAIETGLYTRLHGDATLMGMVTDVARDPAPQGSVLPYIVFNPASDTDNYVFGSEAFEATTYAIKAVTEGGSHKLANDVMDRVKVLLQDYLALAVAGRTVIRCERIDRIEMPSVDDGITYRNAIDRYRIEVQ
jgi:hypothetical protein